MKKIVFILIALCAWVKVSAQTVTEGTQWFDGKVLYTAHVMDNGELYFHGAANVNAIYEFSLRRLNHAPGEYMLIPTNMIDDAPLRAQFGWRVQYIRKQGMYFLAVRNRQDRIVWTLVLTPDNLENCLGQQRFAEEQPVDDMLDGYLMNTKFLARFGKEELKQMHAKLKALPSHTVISETNMQLIESELEVTEAERYLLVGEDENSSDFASGESKDYFGMVTYFPDLAEAMRYISDMGYPQPALSGNWAEGESTFVVLPAESNSVLELWHAEYGEEHELVCAGEKPIVEAAPGKPLCFSHMATVGDAKYMVVCRKSNGSMSSWAPQFDTNDGSMITDMDFIDGTPVG